MVHLNHLMGNRRTYVYYGIASLLKLGSHHSLMLANSSSAKQMTFSLDGLFLELMDDLPPPDQGFPYCRLILYCCFSRAED
jgi:hypothetical protein